MSDEHNTDDIWETNDSSWRLPDDDSWELPDDFVPQPYENIPEVTPTYFDAIGGRTGEGKGFIIGLRALIAMQESDFLPASLRQQEQVFLKDLHPSLSSPSSSAIFILSSTIFLTVPVLSNSPPTALVEFPIYICLRSSLSTQNFMNGA